MVAMPPNVIDAHKRMARYYIQRLREMNTLYDQGGRNIYHALRQLYVESTQIEQTLIWLETHSNDDTGSAALFVEMLLAGRSILQETLTPAYRLSLYQRALSRMQQQGDVQSSLACLYTVAFCYLHLNEIDLALAHFQQLYDLAQAHRYDTQSAESLYRIGALHSRLGRTKESIDWFLQAYHLFRRAKDLKGEVTCLVGLGYAAMDTGDWAKAETYLSAAQAAAMQSDDADSLHRALTGVGQLHHRRGRINDAIPYLQQAKDAAELTGSQLNMMQITLNLAMSYSITEQYAQAFQYYHEALDLSQQSGRTASETEILGNMGYTYYLAGDYENAREHTEAALTLFLNARSYHNACITMANLVAIDTHLGALADARRFVQNGMQLAVDLNNPQLQLMMIVAAVQYLVALVQSPSDQQSDILKTGVIWAGFVYTAPQAEEENRNELDKLRPDMVKILGQPQVEQLLAQGASLKLDNITSHIAHRL